MISRYAATFSPIFLLFFFFFFAALPVGNSRLSSNQTELMLRLSELISNAATSSPWKRGTLNEDPCAWKGVTCSDSSVTALALPGFNISSTEILSVICKIESLQTLDLSNNSLTSIPNGFLGGCGGLKGLRLLNFSRNLLSGNLPDFDGFAALQILDLSYNELSGKIYLQFDGLVALRGLNLSCNLFSGSLPTRLGQAMALETLLLAKNALDGEIPERITEYTNLTLLDISDNHLSGSIPDRIGELSKLEVLVLSSNYLKGEIPRSLATVRSLLRFAANENNFTGLIPPGITSFLHALDLSYNRIGGEIRPELLSQQNLQSVDLTNNRLVGQIPMNLSSSLVRLRLGSNSLSGPIPSALTCMNLAYLELDNNGFNGTIPPQLGSCGALTLLNLANNQLTGTLPPQLGQLSHLRIMKLQSNRLGGSIPERITELGSLLIMNFSFNSLTGPLPLSISKLQNLTNLCLQDNSLKGSIPSSIRSVNRLLELQLGNNQLSGEIPRMPDSLQIALNLSTNGFRGPIPRTLSELPQLEVLDLSNNSFSGKIPDVLASRLSSLIKLVLSNNNLSGEIPPFQHMVDVVTTGNAHLVNTTAAGAKKNGKSIAKAIGIAAPVGVLAVGAITFVTFMIYRRIYRVSNEHGHSGECLSPVQVVVQSNLLTANIIHKSNINLAKAMDAVSLPSNINHKTRFSTYYKATMPSGMVYFVKKLNWTDKIFHPGCHDRFGEELHSLGKMTNSNIMIPLAYVLTVDSAYVLYEYAQKGTLFDVLHGSPENANAMDWASRYSVALGVAQGIAFLHGLASGPLLLLDLSSKTVLLKSMKEPLVGDVELYRVMDLSKSSSSFSTVAGTAGYIPPEYAYTMRVTTAGNVYSFGVVLLELLTGKPAVSEGMELAKWVLSNSAQPDKWDHILDPKILGESLAIRSQMLAVLQIALSCVTLSAVARPQMKTVLRLLINSR